MTEANRYHSNICGFYACLPYVLSTQDYIITFSYTISHTKSIFVGDTVKSCHLAHPDDFEALFRVWMLCIRHRTLLVCVDMMWGLWLVPSCSGGMGGSFIIHDPPCWCYLYQRFDSLRSSDSVCFWKFVHVRTMIVLPQYILRSLCCCTCNMRGQKNSSPDIKYIRNNLSL